MAYVFHTTDVFTAAPFGGNQLAVLPDARGLTTEQMAAIAREFNYSETTFVMPPQDTSNTRHVRIFTPGAELPFAGHPTIGTAFVLASIGDIDLPGAETRIVFEMAVGPVPVLIRAENGKPTYMQLSAAKLPGKGDQSYDRETMARMLSLDPDDIDAAPDRAIESWSAGVPFVYVPVKNLDALGRARVKQDVWERSLRGSSASEIFLFTEDAPSVERNGVRGGDGVIRARMFAPAFGIPEDPATGVAVAALGGYLGPRSSRRDGLQRYTIHQGVEMGRPSRIDLEVDVAAGEVRAVRVGGSSVMVSSGTLHVP